MEVHDFSHMPSLELELLGHALDPLHTLGDLLEWAHHLSPPVPSPIVVTQDEYTHDVLVPYPGGYWLDFDTT